MHGVRAPHQRMCAIGAMLGGKGRPGITKGYVIIRVPEIVKVKRMKRILKNSVNLAAACIMPPSRSPFTLTGHMTFSRAFCVS